VPVLPARWSSQTLLTETIVSGTLAGDPAAVHGLLTRPAMFNQVVNQPFG
jgi:hypothetical protein